MEEDELKSLYELMTPEVKAWIDKLAAMENFSILRHDLESYLFNLELLSREAFTARLKNSHCFKCNKIGCRVKIMDLGSEDKKMLCSECFHSI